MNFDLSFGGTFGRLRQETERDDIPLDIPNTVALNILDISSSENRCIARKEDEMCKECGVIIPCNEMYISRTSYYSSEEGNHPSIHTEPDGPLPKDENKLDHATNMSEATASKYKNPLLTKLMDSCKSEDEKCNRMKVKVMRNGQGLHPNYEETMSLDNKLKDSYGFDDLTSSEDDLSNSKRSHYSPNKIRVKKENMRVQALKLNSPVNTMPTSKLDSSTNSDSEKSKDSPPTSSPGVVRSSTPISKSTSGSHSRQKKRNCVKRMIETGSFSREPSSAEFSEDKIVFSNISKSPLCLECRRNKSSEKQTDFPASKEVVSVKPEDYSETSANELLKVTRMIDFDSENHEPEDDEINMFSEQIFQNALSSKLKDDSVEQKMLENLVKIDVDSLQPTKDSDLVSEISFLLLDKIIKKLRRRLVEVTEDVNIIHSIKSYRLEYAKTIEEYIHFIRSNCGDKYKTKSSLEQLQNAIYKKMKEGSNDMIWKFVDNGRMNDIDVFSIMQAALYAIDKENSELLNYYKSLDVQ